MRLYFRYCIFIELIWFFSTLLIFFLCLLLIEFLNCTWIYLLSQLLKAFLRLFLRLWLMFYHITFRVILVSSMRRIFLFHFTFLLIFLLSRRFFSRWWADNRPCHRYISYRSCILRLNVLIIIIIVGRSFFIRFFFAILKAEGIGSVLWFNLRLMFFPLWLTFPRCNHDIRLLIFFRWILMTRASYGLSSP